MCAATAVRFEIDLRRAGPQLEDRHTRGMSHRVDGDVWIDVDERVRRVTWRRPTLQRPRSPLKIPRVTAWHTLELWDFGVPVHIDIPTPSPPEPGPSLREIYAGLGMLWRRKRSYDRGRS